jgi:hypothetical protein
MEVDCRDAGDFQVAGGGSAKITTTQGWERKGGRKKGEEDRGGQKER